MSLLLLAVSACGTDAPPRADDYGNLLASPSGLVIEASEHPSGWGRADCFLCHEIRSMHTVNRTGSDEVDLAEVRAIVRSGREASCALCHGDNGVPR